MDSSYFRSDSSSPRTNQNRIRLAAAHPTIDRAAYEWQSDSMLLAPHSAMGDTASLLGSSTAGGYGGGLRGRGNVGDGTTLSSIRGPGLGSSRSASPTSRHYFPDHAFDASRGGGVNDTTQTPIAGFYSTGGTSTSLGGAIASRNRTELLSGNSPRVKYIANGQSAINVQGTSLEGSPSNATAMQQRLLNMSHSSSYGQAVGSASPRGSRSVSPTSGARGRARGHSAASNATNLTNYTNYSYASNLKSSQASASLQPLSRSNLIVTFFRMKKDRLAKYFLHWCTHIMHQKHS